jgi:hypothetical protein
MRDLTFVLKSPVLSVLPQPMAPVPLPPGGGPESWLVASLVHNGTAAFQATDEELHPTVQSHPALQSSEAL